MINEKERETIGSMCVGENGQGRYQWKDEISVKTRNKWGSKLPRYLGK